MSFSASAADERVLGVEFTDDALSVSLRDGRVITVPLAWYPRLLNATPAQLQNWKIAGGGYGLHWPDLDEDLSTDGLLRGGARAEASRPGEIAKKGHELTNAVKANREGHEFHSAAKSQIEEPPSTPQTLVIP